MIKYGENNMKTFVFFDLDGTIYNTRHKEVPSETLRLIKELSLVPNFYLGIATGRNVSKSNIISEILPYFKYRVFVNGALGFDGLDLVVDEKIDEKTLDLVTRRALKNEMILGYVGEKEEFITNINDEIVKEITDFMITLPNLTKDILEEDNIYQMWLSSKDKDKLKEILDGTNLKSYDWHSGGADILRSDVNKGDTIKQLLRNETNYRLITVGDGVNDLSMIEVADIGIVMGNSGFLKLKEKADYIAPHIEDNQLYDFFKKIIFWE